MKQETVFCPSCKQELIRPEPGSKEICPCCGAELPLYDGCFLSTKVGYFKRAAGGYLFAVIGITVASVIATASEWPHSLPGTVILILLFSALVIGFDPNRRSWVLLYGNDVCGKTLNPVQHIGNKYQIWADANSHTVERMPVNGEQVAVTIVNGLTFSIAYEKILHVKPEAGGTVLIFAHDKYAYRVQARGMEKQVADAIAQKMAEAKAAVPESKEIAP